MYSESRPKDNPLNWSFRVGSLFGITIRLHLFFILGAALLIGFSLSKAGEGAGLRAFIESVGYVAILFFIVLVHEFGHCWGARKTGGEADEILLWPLGGLAMVRPKHTPYANMVTTIAGPMVNVIFCALSAVTLVAIHGSLGAVPWNPLNPFMPIDPTALRSTLQVWLCVFFGLSYMILLFNLLPIYPLDGGRMLHCYLWPKKGYHNATMIATFVGMVGAIALGLVGLLTGATLMLMIAVFGYITCYSDRRAAKWAAQEGLDSEFGYDFSKGYGAFDDEEQPTKKPGYFERRKQAKEAARLQREQEERERLRRHVDAILLKVHKEGMASLTREERRILEKETERQRTESQ